MFFFSPPSVLPVWKPLLYTNVLLFKTQQIPASLWHSIFKVTPANLFLTPYLLCSPLRSSLSPASSFVPVWIFHIAVAAGAWCRDWALIVSTQCGCCGMRLLGVWCVVTGVWPLMPAGRRTVCLSVCSVTPERRWHGFPTTPTGDRCVTSESYLCSFGWCASTPTV